MRKLTFIVALAVAGLTSLGVATAQTSADPVADLVRAEGVNRDDEVVVARLDWNEDGKSDLLITTGANISMGGRTGGDWNAWLSNASGTYDLAGNVMTPGWTITVAQLPEFGGAKAIVAYMPLGGGKTGINAFYLSSSGKVESKGIGTIENNTEAGEALEQRIFGGAEKVEAERIPAAKLWPKDGPTAKPPAVVPQASPLDTIQRDAAAGRAGVALRNPAEKSS